MRLRVGIALVVMLSMALASTQMGKPDRMRSLVWSQGSGGLPRAIGG